MDKSLAEVWDGNGEIDAITGDVYTWSDELIGNVYEKETNAFTDGSYEGYLKSLPPDNFKSVGKLVRSLKEEHRMIKVLMIKCLRSSMTSIKMCIIKSMTITENQGRG